MSKLIRRVTIVQLPSQPGQAPEAIEVYKKKKRRVSKRLKPAEKMSRRVAQAIQKLGTELIDRQERANKKRKNGWLKRGAYDLQRAQEKALKRLMKP